MATTELSRLPGLEAVTEHEQPAPGHWLERGPQKRLMVFSGRSHPDLAQNIAEKIGVELGGIDLGTFANDETYCRYDESIRGADVFLVQTGCAPVDKNLMELLVMIQAARLASAKRITAVVPLFPYARQDRKAKPREPITARLVADMLQLAGADRVLTMDLHAGQIQGFFTIPVDHMTALPLFANHFRDLGVAGPDVVSVAPDAGRAKMAQRFAEMIEGDLAIMHKTRPAHDLAAVTVIAGRVREDRLRLDDAPRTRVFGPNSVFTVPAVAIHRVLHAGGEPAVTIHAYSPPLVRTGAYRIGADGELERELLSSEDELRATPALG